MDNIYGDLDNYDSVNVVEELKSENEELRAKLGEYTVAMDKLQKEFDHLSAEFKKLEMNYSSLLKTAKAEIERKSQMITSLNKEKDMMVLNAIQNRTMTPRNVLKPYVPQNKEKRHDKSDEVLKKIHNSPKENVPNISIYSILPTMDTVSNLNTDVSMKSQECKVSLPIDKDKSLEFKENCNVAKLASSKIRLRRKSMPAIRHDDLSSLSGEEDSFLSKKYRKDSQTQHDRHTKSSKKGSETSSVDEKYSSHKDSSLETYHRSRHSKHYESDKYTSSRNCYDSEKFRRMTSPDHLLRRATRNSRSNQYPSHRYSETNYKYGHRSKSRDPRNHYDKLYDDRQSYSDHRAHYDRQSYFDRREDQLPRQSYSDRLPGKHKTHSDYDSYSAKRMKIDGPDRRREDNVYQMDNNYTDEELFQKVIGDVQYTSCQSPDFMHTEYPTQDAIKEIKLTSDTILEDPRLFCAKYSLKSDNSTVKRNTPSKQNIDLVPIDKLVWNIPEFPEDDPFKRRSDQVKPEIKKKYQLETSGVAESAKSPSFNESFMETQNTNVNRVDSVKATETVISNDLTTLESKSNTNQITKVDTLINVKDITAKNVSKPDTKHIEKERKSDKKDLSQQAKKSRKCSETSSVEQANSADTASHNEDCISPENLKSIKIITNRISRNNLKSLDDPNNILLSENHTRIDKKLTNREIVAGDLELSDETSDNTDFDLKQIQTKSKKGRKSRKPQFDEHKEISNICLDKLIEEKSKICDKLKRLSSLDSDKKTDANKQLNNNKNVENKETSNNTDLDLKQKQKYPTGRKSIKPQFEKHKETSSICLENLKKEKSKICEKAKHQPDLDIDKKTDANKQLGNNKNAGNVLLDVNSAKLPQSDSEPDTRTKETQKGQNEKESKKIEKLSPSENVDVNSAKLPQSDSKPDTRTKETQKGQNEKESKKIEKLSPSENEKSVCTNIKKYESKKKTKKTSKKISETTEIKSEEKKKSIKEKGSVTTPIKNKFTDLFGENSSLITPEDLGLTACQPELRASANYVPMSEDAQDAMDIVSVEETACNQKEIQKAVVDTGNPQKNICQDKPINNAEDISQDKPITNTEHISQDKPIINALNTSQERPTVNTEVFICNKSKSVPDINTENQKELSNLLTIRPDTTEPEFIKTVIISTGVQQTGLQANLPKQSTEPVVQPYSLLMSNKATIDAVNSLQALATSTPHKSFFDIIPKSSDLSNTSSDSRTSSNINIANDQSSKSMTEAQNNDAPDVRIVLKRKRRVIKK